MKNILIIYHTTGGGHVAISKAIQSYLPKDTYNVVLWNKFDSLLIDAFPELYNTALNAKLAWQIIYHLMNNGVSTRVMKLYEAFVARKMPEMVAEFEPNFVLSVHPLTNEIVKRIGKILSIPTGVFIADPFTVHSTWTSSELDYFLVPFQETKEAIQERKNVKNIQVLSFPVHQSFMKSKTRAEVFASLQLQDMYSITLSSGGLGKIRADTIEGIVKQIDKKANFIIICGKNTVLKEKLEASDSIKNNSCVRVCGFVENMNEILSISSIHLMKGGPSSIFETLVTSAVPYIYDFLKEQEVGNVEFITYKGLGKVGSIYELQKDLILPEEELEKYQSLRVDFVNRTHLLDQAMLWKNFFDTVLR